MLLRMIQEEGRSKPGCLPGLPISLRNGSAPREYDGSHARPETPAESQSLGEGRLGSLRHRQQGPIVQARRHDLQAARESGAAAAARNGDSGNQGQVE